MLTAGRFELGRTETAMLRTLVTSSVRTTPEGSEEESALEPDVVLNWRSLFASAERHRLSPLVLRGARARGVLLRAPVAERRRLENQRHLELARAVVRLHHVDELAGAALEAGKDLCLLKGAAFAEGLYGDPSLRPMTDIDVLTSATELEFWTERLEGLGYVAIDRSDHATCFRRRQTGVLLELHRDLVSAASYLGVRTEEFLERSVPMVAPTGGESRLRTLSWEDHLVHLCLHASFQHGFRQPAVNAWDAHSIAERDDFDLARFVELSGRPRLACWVYGGLAMGAAAFPGVRLREARVALESRVPAGIARKSRRFRPEALLSPGPDSVFGAPYRRISWNGISVNTLLLLWEMSGPRHGREAGGWVARLDRILQLIRNHGIGIFRSTRSEPAYPGLSSRPASLGEVRDV